DRRRDQAIDLRLERQRRRGHELERLMRTLSHESVLERGFAIVFDAKGHPVKQAAAVQDGDRLNIRFRDGEIAATAGESHGTPKAPAYASAKTEPSKNPAKPAKSGQGSLF
ncbi:exodeoxyribonuclease VII large subunit, partial [Paraburkholderia aspalathi]|nr:exodeoxyribonuclease VII large subunit [Paraburkholderia aspalathi]